MSVESFIKDRFGPLAKPALGFGKAPIGTPLQEHLKRETLNQKEINQILLHTGMALAEIHERKGEKFGFIDLMRGVMTKDYIGAHDNWYEFLMSYYDNQTYDLEEILGGEKLINQQYTKLTPEQRDEFDYLFRQRERVRAVFEDKRDLLTSVEPQVLHGNLYIGSIFVNERNEFEGIGDFTQVLVGDPVDDLAYFSVMPQGEQLLPKVQGGWVSATGKLVDEEKFHLYRLWQSYRKIGTRYIKHRYLGNYPEPLRIAREEIKNLTGSE